MPTSPQKHFDLSMSQYFAPDHLVVIVDNYYVVHFIDYLRI